MWAINTKIIETVSVKVTFTDLVSSAKPYQSESIKTSDIDINYSTNTLSLIGWHASSPH